MAIKYVKRLAGPYVGVGQTTFTFSFLIYEASDVYVGTAMSEAERTSILEINTDYTVSMNADQQATPGGTITLKTPLVEGQIVVIGSDLDYEQFLQLTNYSRFPPELVNKALDRLCIQIQQIVEKIGRTLSVPATSSETPESMIERLLKAQNEAKQYAVQAQNSAEASKKSATEAKGLRDETAGYAEAAKVLVPIKEEIKKVATIDGETKIVADNINDVRIVASDLDVTLYENTFDYGDYDTNTPEGPELTPEITGGYLKTVAPHVDELKRIADNIDPILSITGEIDKIPGYLEAMDRKVAAAQSASESALTSAGQAEKAKTDAQAQVTISRDWATKMDGLVNDEDYSAKHYAKEAKKSSESATTTLAAVKNAGTDAVASIGSSVTAGESTIAKATTAGVSQINTTKDGAVSAVNQAGQTQKSAIDNEATTQIKKVTDAGTTQVNAVGTKGTEVIKSVEAEWTNQVKIVQTEGQKQVAAAKEAAKTAAFAYRFSTSTITPSGVAPKTQLTPNDNIKVGDHVVDGTGAVYEITAVDAENFTVGTKQADLKGPKGDPGTTDYNQLQNKPALGALASKSTVSASDLADSIDYGDYQ